jgi:hypothetical protein
MFSAMLCADGSVAEKTHPAFAPGHHRKYRKRLERYL